MTLPAKPEPFALSKAELDAYRRDGFLVRERVFIEAEVARFQAAAEAAAARAQAVSDSGRTYHLDGRRFVDVGSMTVQYEYTPGSEESVSTTYSIVCRQQQWRWPPSSCLTMRYSCSVIG